MTTSVPTFVRRAREWLARTKLAHALHELYQRTLSHRLRAWWRRSSSVVVTSTALFLLFLAMGGTWHIASASPTPSSASTPAHALQPSGDDARPPPRKSGKDLGGKVNLNTATEEQLMLLPTVGPAKAERIVTWRKKNGGFRRIADLRRVKGFGYKTFKRLEPFLDITGETTLK